MIVTNLNNVQLQCFLLSLTALDTVTEKLTTLEKFP